MTDTEALQVKLGLPSAPLVMAGLATAAHFFRTQIGQDPVRWWEYFRGIDFHKPVDWIVLKKGTLLVRFESLGDRSFKPFVYFTVPGASPFRVGTSFPQSEFKLFETGRSTPALRSIASGINFGPADRVSRLGGSTQYIIAFADAPVLLRTRSAHTR